MKEKIKRGIAFVTTICTILGISGYKISQHVEDKKVSSIIEQHMDEYNKINISNFKDIKNISILEGLVYKTNKGELYTWEDIINKKELTERDVYRLYKMAISAKIAPVIGESAQYIIDNAIINSSVSIGNFSDFNRPYIKIDDSVYYIDPTEKDELSKACINYENADLAASGSYRHSSLEDRINALKRFLSCDITKKGKTLNGTYNIENANIVLNAIKNNKTSQLKDLKAQALKAKVAMKSQNYKTLNYNNVNKNIPRRG